MSDDGPGRVHPVTRWLQHRSAPVFAAFAIAAAFSAYFCMYAFRKPFAAAAWPGQVELFGYSLGLKTALIIAQVLGYCLSKFIGIKVISEMDGKRRNLALLVLIGVAELALVALAVAPTPWRPLCLFVNGMPLGMIWGLVFGSLEGRKLSEVLGAGLSASYIVASGFVKTAGLWLMDAGVPMVWMPAVTGLCFAPILVTSVWMLARLPPPTPEDEALRTRRAPMAAEARRSFIRAYAPGLLPLTILYILLTAYRDFRDNFAPELWGALGYADAPEVLTTAEIPIAAVVLLALAAIMAIKDNRRALKVLHGLMFAGALIITGSTALWQLELLDPALWMVAVGLGLYIGYVPYGCVLFDRLIATLGVVGTAGFMIYVTDAFGYAGSVTILLIREFGSPELSWLEFFTGLSHATGLCAAVGIGLSWLYFRGRTRSNEVRMLPSDVAPE